MPLKIGSRRCSNVAVEELVEYSMCFDGAFQLTDEKRGFVRSNLNWQTHSVAMGNLIGAYFFPGRSFAYAHSEAYVS